MFKFIIFTMLFSFTAYAQVRVKENIKQQSVTSSDSGSSVDVKKPKSGSKKKR